MLWVETGLVVARGEGSWGLSERGEGMKYKQAVTN